MHCTIKHTVHPQSNSLMAKIGIFAKHLVHVEITELKLGQQLLVTNVDKPRVLCRQHLFKEDSTKQQQQKLDKTKHHMY